MFGFYCNLCALRQNHFSEVLISYIHSRAVFCPKRYFAMHETISINILYVIHHPKYGPLHLIQFICRRYRKQVYQKFESRK